MSAALPSFWLEVAWLWQVPPPDPEIALLQIIGKPYADHRRDQMRRMGLWRAQAGTGAHPRAANMSARR